jgi:SNW domain-containing protein 1
MSVSALSAALPKPQYSEESSRGVRNETQLVPTRTKAPAYPHRKGWRPRDQQAFEDGGAYPEVLIAQYPLDMGRGNGKSNALALKTGTSTESDYASQIARRGHAENRIIQSSFKDLIPLRQQANSGELDLARPSESVSPKFPSSSC